MAKAFGLDIGRSFVKLIEVEISGNKKTITAAQSIQTPAGGIQSDSSVDLKKLSEAIKVCVDAAKVSGKSANISLTEAQVVTRLIEMPNLTDKELAAAINWEAEQYVPLPLKDVNLQYKVVSKADVNIPGSKMEILLVAAPKRVIEKYVNVVRDAGLGVNAVETESAALARALTTSVDMANIIVSLGALSTEIIITKGSDVLLTHSVATGGVNLTRAVMAEFNLPQAQAEEYKQAYGILEDKLSGKVAAVIKPVLEIIISEISKSSEFVKTKFVGTTISRIIICGGGSFLPGLSRFLTERTNLEVSLGDAWADFSKEGQIVNLSGLGGVYAVATGLALRR